MSGSIVINVCNGSTADASRAIPQTLIAALNKCGLTEEQIEVALNKIEVLMAELQSSCRCQATTEAAFSLNAGTEICLQLYADSGEWNKT